MYYIRAFGNSVEFCFGIFLFFNGAWILIFESGISRANLCARLLVASSLHLSFIGDAHQSGTFLCLVVLLCYLSFVFFIVLFQKFYFYFSPFSPVPKNDPSFLLNLLSPYFFPYTFSTKK